LKKLNSGDLAVYLRFSVQSMDRMASNIRQIAEADTEIELDKLLESAIEPNCRVFIHNDEITPYEFVVIILQRIFRLKPLEAEHVTFIAHTNGIALVCTLPCPEAYKRVGKAHFAASLDGYPLMFTVEPED
jgi:ATP-dependent Clp protease adaptor protein ClpS